MYTKFLNLLNILAIFGSMLIALTISIEFFRNITMNIENILFLKIQLWVCMLFILDYLARLVDAKNKVSFIFKNLFLLLISIPYINIAVWYDITITHELSVILRILPIFRGAIGVGMLLRCMNESRATSLFASYITILLSFTYFISIIFYYVEKGVNTNIVYYGDAIWWACMNVTTVGSPVAPVTGLGKTLAVILAAMGMMMFPIFTAYVTDYIRRKHTNKQGKTEEKLTEKTEHTKQTPL